MHLNAFYQDRCVSLIQKVERIIVFNCNNLKLMRKFITIVLLSLTLLIGCVPYPEQIEGEELIVLEGAFLFESNSRSYWLKRS